MYYSTVNDLRLSVAGHLFILTTVGQIRGFTTLQPKITEYFDCSTQESSYVLTFWCLGSAVAGFFPSYVLPVTGIKKSVILAGAFNILAYCLAGFTIGIGNIMLTLASVKFFCFLPLILVPREVELVVLLLTLISIF